MKWTVLSVVRILSQITIEVSSVSQWYMQFALD